MDSLIIRRCPSLPSIAVAAARPTGVSATFLYAIVRANLIRTPYTPGKWWLVYQRDALTLEDNALLYRYKVTRGLTMGLLR
jgi:hypothetical protein